MAQKIEVLVQQAGFVGMAVIFYGFGLMGISIILPLLNCLGVRFHL